MTHRTILCSAPLVLLALAACESGGGKPSPAAPASTASAASSASASAAPAAPSTSLSAASAASATTAPAIAPASADPKADVAKLADATVAFGEDLLARVDDKGNVVFSPTSIEAALAMTSAGARGATAREIGKALHLEALEGERLHAAFGALLGSWSVKGSGEPELDVANRLYGQKGYPFVPDFVALTKERYGAELATVDYVGANEAARAQINGWVSERTNKAIQELIGKGVLNTDTRLTLVDAIHLKGSWTERFPAGATHPAKFHAPGHDVEVPTMVGVRRTRFAEAPDAQIIALPFASAGAYELELDVVLPSAPAKGAPQAKPSLRAWTTALDAAAESTVTLTMPRFKIGSTFGLAPTLSAMGMPMAFSRDADFSGIDGKKDLYVQAVVHRAVLDVYETGAEAAAATAVVMGTKGLVIPAHKMTVDRAFYVLIRDRKSGALLFLAHVRDPKSA